MVRRGAVEQLACAKTADKTFCTTYPRRRRDVLPEGLVLEHPDRAVPGRPDERDLQGLRGLDPGLDHDQGLSRCLRSPLWTAAGAVTARAGGPGRRFAAWLNRHGWVRLAALLSAPMAVARRGLPRLAGADVRLRTVDGEQLHHAAGTGTDAGQLPHGAHRPVYRDVALRSLGIAIAVTLIDALIALPMAVYMAKVASPRARHWLVIAILTPLWASYLVKAYSWRVMLANGGPVDWLLGGRATDPGMGRPPPSWCWPTCGCRT